jgi:hypothetical protein
LQKVLGAGWLLAGVCLAVSILVQQKLILDDATGNTFGWKIFVALSRLIWPLGISWIIFMCESGYGGMYYERYMC